MIFNTKIQGIPCQCSVVCLGRESPMIRYGSGAGDVIAPEYPEFEFTILDRKGYKAPWLEKKLTQQDEVRLQEEFLLEKSLEDYDGSH